MERNVFFVIGHRLDRNGRQEGAAGQTPVDHQLQPEGLRHARRRRNADRSAAGVPSPAHRRPRSGKRQKKKTNKIVLGFFFLIFTASVLEDGQG